MNLYSDATYTSHLYPDAVVVGEAALQVGGQLARVDVLGQALQGGQVCLGERGVAYRLLCVKVSAVYI